MNFIKSESEPNVDSPPLGTKTLPRPLFQKHLNEINDLVLPARYRLAVPEVSVRLSESANGALI